MNKRPRLNQSIKRLADRLFYTLYRSTLLFRRTEPTKTVLIVRTDGIGDLVFFTRYLNAIRKRYAGCELVLCCTEETAGLAVAVTLIDRVIPFRTRRYGRNYVYRLKILKNIRLTRPHVAIYPNYHRAHIGDEMTLLSGAPQTVAFSGNDELIHASMRQRNNLRYTRIVGVPDHVPERIKYRELLAALACAPEEQFDDADFLRFVTVPESHVAEEQRAPKTNARFVIIAPGGSSAIRRWPWTNFTELADRIVSELGLAVVLCGNQDDLETLRQIAGEMKAHAEVISSLDLPQIISLLRTAATLVGNESALLHLAASLTVPAVGILGGGHFSRYFPYGSAHIVNNIVDCYECNWHCTFPRPHCITDIPVDQVMDVCRKLLVGKA